MKLAPWIRTTLLTLSVLLVSAACAAPEPAASQSADPRAAKPAEGSIATISVADLKQRMETPGEKPLVVDVREQNEYDASHIDGVRLAPLGNVETSLADVPKDREILLICRSGNRSGKAAKRLAARGYTRLSNVDGGMLAWEKNGYPTVK